MTKLCSVFLMNVKVGVKDQQLIHALFHGVFLSVVFECIRHWNWQQLISVENRHACTCVVGNTKEPVKKKRALFDNKL